LVLRVGLARPLDVAGGGAGWDQPVVAGAILTGAKLNLNAILKFDPLVAGRDCQRALTLVRSALIPAPQQRADEQPIGFDADIDRPLERHDQLVEVDAGHAPERAWFA